uniref:Uncharacterized protein n=1 Tax=Moniliophthora roreri TaxID=221103 RepID=A0A0W0FI08_MONRR
MTIDLTEFKKTLSNAHKFLPEKASLSIVVDNFCCEAFNSLAGLSDDNMLAVSKNHELVELCITVFKEVTNSPVWNVINDQVHKSVSNNVLYVEQLVAGMHKPDKSAPTEPSVHPIKAKSLSKADIEDFLTNIEKSGEEEPAPCTHSHRKGATDEGSLFHTVEELQQELLLLPFGSMEAKSTLTLMSLYNAATAALTSHLFSVHKALQDYKDTLVTCNEISRILCDCHVTLLSPLAYDTKDVDMPMVQ